MIIESFSIPLPSPVKVKKELETALMFRSMHFRQSEHPEAVLVAIIICKNGLVVLMAC